MTTITDAVRLLFAIERGDIRIKAEVPANDIYAGNVTYRTQDGWILTIFNDCGEFDYVDRVEAPDGTAWECHDNEFFFQYRPPKDVVRKIYKIYLLTH